MRIKDALLHLIESIVGGVFFAAVDKVDPFALLDDKSAVGRDFSRRGIAVERFRRKVAAATREHGEDHDEGEKYDRELFDAFYSIKV